MEQLSSFFPQQHHCGSSRSAANSSSQCFWHHVRPLLKSDLTCWERKEGVWRQECGGWVRREGRNVTFTLSRTILKEDHFSQLWGMWSLLLYKRGFNTQLWMRRFLFFHKVRDTKSPRWPCNAVTEGRRYSMPRRETERKRESSGRNSWLEWRKGQHSDTDSWGVLKMTNRPAGRDVPLNLTVPL